VHLGVGSAVKADEQDVAEIADRCAKSLSALEKHLAKP
jgi:hypothetical protein